MKKYIKSLLAVFIAMLSITCTENFDEINTDTQQFTTDEVSAKFFLTSTQVNLYAPSRFEYWRAQLIHSDRFAGHVTFGFNTSFFGDNLCYDFNAGYTDATFNWLANLFGTFKSFSDLTTVGGDFENEFMFAMSLIMKGALLSNVY